VRSSTPERTEDNASLAIRSSLEFDGNDEIDPRSGNFRIMAFDPHDDHLTPIQYEYRLPLDEDGVG